MRNAPAAVFFISLLFILQLLAAPLKVPAQTAGARSVGVAVERALYRIELKLDFDGRRYEGTQRVLWVNRDERPASTLYFHLYPNLRASHDKVDVSGNDADEPRLEVLAVRAAQNAQSLAFTLEDGGLTLRVQLREQVAGGASTEVEITFRGSVPEIDPDETSLPAHVFQQVGAVLRDTPEARRARDLNFSSRGVMLLGTFHPVLVPRTGGEWRREVRPGVGDLVFAEAADYDVRLEVAENVATFTSGDGLGGITPEGDDVAMNRGVRTYGGRGLRSFSILAGRRLRAEEREAAGLRVRSVFRPEHAAVGHRVLEVASRAARVFASRFGELPFKTITVAEAPLVAGLGSAEFSGLSAIASAFYVDFDSPATRNLPELVREQRASLEDSLEFAAAHLVAHQWWGASVGNDARRVPVLDEALAHWSALLYYEEAQGAERARLALEDQLRGVYQVYRTFGGRDLPADRPAREYVNSFQYAAIVAAKGALFFVELRRLLGDERFFRALRGYYEAHTLGIARLEDLRAAFAAEAPPQRRRAVNRTFTRWLSERHGDQDVAPPNPQLARDLGIRPARPSAGDDNALSRLGRLFWRQMTRIR